MELNEIIYQYKSCLLAAGILILAGLTSCTPEERLLPEAGMNRTVTFSVTIPQNVLPETRAMSEKLESQVSNIQILVFEPNGDFLYQVYTKDVVTSGSETTFTVPLVEGTSDLILLANAKSIMDQYYPDGIPEGESREKVAGTLKRVNENKWGTSTTIPMWGECRGVKIEEGSNITGIKLHRMLAKINITVSTTTLQLTEIYLCNASTQGLLIPQESSWNKLEDKAEKVSLPDDWTRGNTQLAYTNNAYNKAFVNEIYTFETAAGDPDNINDNTYLIIGGANNYVKGYFRIDLATEEGEYLPLLRNHRYEINITKINGRGASTMEEAAQRRPGNITYGIEVFDDSKMGYFVWDNQYFLGAEVHDLTVFHNGGDFSLDIETDYPDGWTAYASKSQYNNIPIDWITLHTTSGAAGKTTLHFTVDDPSTAQNTGYFVMNAGPLNAAIRIVKTKAPSHANPSYAYAGAFWKNNQTGERIISIPGVSFNVGGWRAYVTEGEDWIVLDTEQTEDPGITWNASTENPADMNLPANDQKYQVKGNNKMVYGQCEPDGMIRFRIGLTGTNPSASPRYGRVRLEYRDYNYYTFIYIRQGEEPDYLFRPEDAAPDGWSWGTADKPRPFASKISPYNLTSPEYLDGTKTGGTDIANHSQLAVKGGVFTEYPTQAGAYFHWSNSSSNIRYAYHAGHFPSADLRIAGYITHDDGLAWDEIQGDTTQEVCPPGFHRPAEGRTDKFMPQSEWTDLYEMGQSLFEKPELSGKYSYSMGNSSNFKWGYYADGFFDRREVVDFPDYRWSTTPRCVVDLYKSTAAYQGGLFYNRNNNASIFFPAAGKLDSGGVNIAGEYSIFWLKSRAEYVSAMNLESKAPWSVKLRILHSGGAASIRCIQD